MPKRKRYRRRRYRRRRRRGPLTKRGSKYLGTVSRQRGLGFADRQYVRMPTVAFHTVTGVAGPTIRYVRGNSILFPYVSPITGKLPSQFSEVFSIYDRVRVHACKLQLTVINVEDAIPLAVGLIPAARQETSFGIQDCIGNKFARYRICGQGSTGQAKQNLSMFVKTQSMFSGQDIRGTQNFIHSSSADVSLPWYFNIVLDNTTLAGNVSCDMIMKCTFYCEFIRLNPQLLENQV